MKINMHPDLIVYRRSDGPQYLLLKRVVPEHNPRHLPMIAIRVVIGKYTVSMVEIYRDNRLIAIVGGEL